MRRVAVFGATGSIERALAQAGIATGVMVAPIIPALTDHEIERILEAAAAAGLDAAAAAEVFDSDGNTLVYDSEDSARAALMDAEFVALEGLDEDDALERGFSLAEVAPPQAEHDADLRERMVTRLGGRA